MPVIVILIIAVAVVGLAVLAAAVKIVRNWLRNASAGSGVVIPSAKTMVERYERFRRDLPRLSRRFRLDPDELIFNDFTTLTAEWLSLNGW